MTNDLIIPRSEIVVFADGACSGNPGPGGWGSIIVTPKGHVWELGGAAPSTTNNQMELTAAIEALITLKAEPLPIWLYTDSVYLIRGITQWIHGWRRRNWRTVTDEEVANQNLWEELSRLVQMRGKSGIVTWKFVKGHSGVPGNERCDEIAVDFRSAIAGKGQRPRLFHGSITKYPYAILDLPPDVPIPEIKERKEKPKAFSYISVVDGIPMRHETWADCEKRVKGKSKARFKKATSQQEELEILKQWGVKLS